MNNLKGELKDLYVKNGYRLDFDLMWLWINQNYISKEEMLELECLKEEKLIDDTKVDCMILEKTWEDNDLKVIRNQLREEIKKEIEKL